jgi:hypothetical protein
VAVGERAEPRRRFGGVLLAAAALLAAAVSPVLGIDLPLPGLQAATLHGYYKNFVLALDSSDPLIEDGVEDLNRARLMLEGRIDPHLDFAVHYEHLLAIHPRGTAANLFLAAGPNRPGIKDLSWSIISSDDVCWRHEIDRLYVHSTQSWGDVTLGRQAIGWGVGLIWSPEDLFVAFSPVEIDREYRLGVDAARAVFSLGSFTELEAVYAVYDKDFDDQIAALRWRTTLTESNLDVGLMAGKFFDDAVIGVLASGELGGAGLHGEVTGTHYYGGGIQRVGAQDFARAVVGADYRFPGEIRAVGEYYFNGFGKTDAKSYLDLAGSPRFARGEIYNVGRHYLGFVVDWEAHPLLHVLAQGQWNLLDPSALVGPAFSISLSDEAELDGGAYFALGAERDAAVLRSEFGSEPSTYYLTAKIYF